MVKKKEGASLSFFYGALFCTLWVTPAEQRVLPLELEKKLTASIAAAQEHAQKRAQEIQQKIEAETAPVTPPVFLFLTSDAEKPTPKETWYTCVSQSAQVFTHINQEPEPSVPPARCYQKQELDRANPHYSLLKEVAPSLDDPSGEYFIFNSEAYKNAPKEFKRAALTIKQNLPLPSRPELIPLSITPEQLTAQVRIETPPFDRPTPDKKWFTLIPSSGRLSAKKVDTPFGHLITACFSGDYGYMDHQTVKELTLYTKKDSKMQRAFRSNEPVPDDYNEPLYYYHNNDTLKQITNEHRALRNAKKEFCYRYFQDNDGGYYGYTHVNHPDGSSTIDFSNGRFALSEKLYAILPKTYICPGEKTYVCPGKIEEYAHSFYKECSSIQEVPESFIINIKDTRSWAIGIPKNSQVMHTLTEEEKKTLVSLEEAFNNGTLFYHHRGLSAVEKISSYTLELIQEEPSNELVDPVFYIKSNRQPEYTITLLKNKHYEELLEQNYNGHTVLKKSKNRLTSTHILQKKEYDRATKYIVPLNSGAKEVLPILTIDEQSTIYQSRTGKRTHLHSASSESNTLIKAKTVGAKIALTAAETAATTLFYQAIKKIRMAHILKNLTESGKKLLKGKVSLKKLRTNLSAIPRNPFHKRTLPLLLLYTLVTEASGAAYNAVEKTDTTRTQKNIDALIETIIDKTFTPERARLYITERSFPLYSFIEYICMRKTTAIAYARFNTSKSKKGEAFDFLRRFLIAYTTIHMIDKVITNQLIKGITEKSTQFHELLESFLAKKKGSIQALTAFINQESAVTYNALFHRKLLKGPRASFIGTPLADAQVVYVNQLKATLLINTLWQTPRFMAALYKHYAPLLKAHVLRNLR